SFKTTLRTGDSNYQRSVGTADVDEKKPPAPRVAVLLGTHDGAQWLERQVETVLKQKAVSLSIFISDDDSKDHTRECIQLLAQDRRVVALPKSPQPLGSASANFQRLIRDVGAEDFDYFAFCDQDDEWMLDRLSVAIKSLQKNNADGF